jgi:hypothetical protein
VVFVSVYVFVAIASAHLRSAGTLLPALPGREARDCTPVALSITFCDVCVVAVAALALFFLLFLAGGWATAHNYLHTHLLTNGSATVVSLLDFGALQLFFLLIL